MLVECGNNEDCRKTVATDFSRGCPVRSYRLRFKICGNTCNFAKVYSSLQTFRLFTLNI